MTATILPNGRVLDIADDGTVFPRDGMVPTYPGWDQPQK